MVEWYRADPWPSIRPVLLVGPPLLTLGGLVVAVSFLTHQPREVRVVAAVAGLALVAGGALFTMISMHWTLRDDTYIALRTDGVVIQSAGSEVLIAWDGSPAKHGLGSLAGQSSSGERQARVVILGRPFARIAGPALALRVKAVQRQDDEARPAEARGASGPRAC